MGLDYEARDRLLTAFWTQEEQGGIRSFRGVSGSVLEILLGEGFAQPEDRQNEAPPISRFLEFLLRYEDVTAHGYAVMASRADARISIEGVEYNGPVSPEMEEEAKDIFGNADEFLMHGDGFYVWYD